VAELRLRAAGVPVVATDDDGAVGLPYLYIHLQALREKETYTAAYFLTIAIRQNVQTEHGVTVFGAETGMCGTSGLGGEARVAGAVIADLERCVDEFALAFLRANARDDAEQAGKPPIPTRRPAKSNASLRAKGTGP
jgi:hypothetical protein